MKARRQTFFFASFFVLFILACNMPSPIFGSPGVENTATPEALPTNTQAVVGDNMPTLVVPTDTPIPFTPTPQISPKLTLTKNSNCRIGPSTLYNVVDQITANSELPVTGRNEDNTWWQVINATNRECWIFNENATPNTDFSFLNFAEAPPLPGIPQNFLVVDQLCQPGPKKFSITLSWSSGGGETAFRLYRDGGQISEFKPNRFNYKDPNAPYNKNISYELEAVNENGVSEKAIQIIPACK